MTVISAIATLRLDVLTSYFVPIILYCIINIVVLLASTLYFAPKMCKMDWFEKALMNYGQSSGETTTGLALLRCVDPNLCSSTMDSKGVATALLLPITGLFPAMIPIMALESELSVIGVGMAIIIPTLIIIRIFFWNKSKIK